MSSSSSPLTWIWFTSWREISKSQTPSLSRFNTMTSKRSSFTQRLKRVRERLRSSLRWSRDNKSRTYNSASNTSVISWLMHRETSSCSLQLRTHSFNQLALFQTRVLIKQDHSFNPQTWCRFMRRVSSSLLLLNPHSNGFLNKLITWNCLCLSF